MKFHGQTIPMKYHVLFDFLKKFNKLCVALYGLSANQIISRRILELLIIRNIKSLCLCDIKIMKKKRSQTLSFYWCVKVEHAFLYVFVYSFNCFMVSFSSFISNFVIYKSFYTLYCVHLLRLTM